MIHFASVRIIVQAIHHKVTTKDLSDIEQLIGWNEMKNFDV